MSSVLDQTEHAASRAFAVSGRQASYLDVPGTESAGLLSVASYDITERMGDPVTISIRISHPRAISRRDYLNREASFSFTSDDGVKRKFSGFIAAFSKLKTTHDFVSYEVVIKSRLARLQGCVIQKFTSTRRFRKFWKRCCCVMGSSPISIFFGYVVNIRRRFSVFNTLRMT